MMQSYSARYASFTPPYRSKSSSKGITDLKWPHPASFLATPSSLASAGFYFNPSAITPDAVSCFICDKGLADWDPEDDPAKIHIQKCPKCPWAMLKCATDADDNGSLKFSSSRLPLSRTMEKARLATFGPEGNKWWPHDVKKKGPTSKMMAKAGFVYAPVNNKDDTCTCIYCGIELAGWEPEDDPMEEHRSRQAKKGPCPFFANSGGVSGSTKRSRSKSKALPTTPIVSSDQDYHPPGTRSSTRTPSSKQPGSSARSKASAKSSKKAPKLKKTIEEEVVAEYRIALNEDEDAPPKPRPKPRRASSRSRSRSRSRASSTRGTTTDDTDVDVSLVSSAPMPETQPYSKLLDNPEDTSPVSSASVSTMQPLSNSFQSPEDQEFAREELALEEQARQLMLADTTFSLASKPPLRDKGFIVKSHNEVTEGVTSGRSQRVPAVDNGKGKVKAPIRMPSTPPRPAPVARATLPSVVKFPQLLPEDSVVALTETERAMTVEQWVRHEMDRQYERLKTDGRQKIDAFKARAIEVAKQIELL